MEIVIVIDNNGEEVKVDLKFFVHHINLYHKTGISIHDESGHYFTVDDNFRRKLKVANSSCLYFSFHSLLFEPEAFH